jgi:hypothetical protein
MASQVSSIEVEELRNSEWQLSWNSPDIALASSGNSTRQSPETYTPKWDATNSSWTSFSNSFGHYVSHIYLLR